MKNRWIVSALALTALVSGQALFASAAATAPVQVKKAAEVPAAPVVQVQQQPAAVAVTETADDDLIVVDDEEDDGEIADASATAPAVQKR